ncbi:MAG TPA: ATP-binding protein, partial [Abditibacteriaceae bacterium]
RLGSWELDLIDAENLGISPLRWSDQVFRIFGYQPGEIEVSNHNFFRAVHPDDREHIRKTMAQALEKGEVYRIDHRILLPDGTERIVHEQSEIVFDPDTGKALRMVGTVQDITERKESEDELRRLHDELDLRVRERTAELGQANAALQTQVTERQQAEAETRTRARQQEAVAQLGQSALTGIDIDTLLKGATALVAATLDVEIGSTFELTPDGSTLRFRAGTGWGQEMKDYAVVADSTSQAGYALVAKAPVIVRNLKKEKRFPPSPLLLEKGVVSGVTVIIGGYEQPFGTLGAHTTQQRRFTRDDVNFLQAVANVLAAALEQRRIETAIRQLNEQLKETNEQLRLENIDRIMAMGALREVTEGLLQAKEEAEEAREHAEVANRAKSEFLSRMSHELRTPLNAIIGFGQILAMRGGDADPQQQENVRQILKAGRHLLDLINEVLDISRIEAGHLSLSLEPIPVGNVVSEVLGMVKPLAENGKIEIVNEMQLAAGAHHVLADQQRLKQVLLNLLSNAVKYNSIAGRVVVSCEVKESAPAIYAGIDCAGRLRVQVQDTGPGLLPEEMARLFVPFERLGAARTQIEGTGIGLSLSRKLIEAMHGEVGVESEPGKGSTFWIELPLVQGAQLQKPHVSESTPSYFYSDLPHVDDVQSVRTILYIEDNVANMSLIERVLSSYSEKVRLLPAMQGSMGIELAIQHRPDLILLDVNLPDIQGDVVLEQLKNSEITRSIPVVVLSADATTRQVERMKDAGAAYYLTKPLDVGQFFDVLSELLKG